MRDNPAIPSRRAKAPEPPDDSPAPESAAPSPNASAKPAKIRKAKAKPSAKAAAAKAKAQAKAKREKARKKAAKAKADAKARRERAAERKKAKKAALRQRQAERKKAGAERRRQARRNKAEEQRWRELDRRRAAREKAAEDRKRNRWEKAIDRKAYQAYLKRLADIWEPGLKYRLVPRVGEPPEETPVRKAAEKRAFREYKKYRANMKRDKDSVKHERVEKEVSMYLRHCFPDWIMEDAIAAGICRLWPMQARRAVRRNTARWRAHKVWQSLCPMARDRALVIDAARKREEELTSKEIAERVIKVFSVQHGAEWINDENSNQRRRETYNEVCERVLAGSGKGRMAGDPLEDAIIAEEAKLALTESGLDDRELAVVKSLQGGMTRQEAAEHFKVEPERISQITGAAAQKISDRLAIPRRLCHFERKKRESGNVDIKSQRAGNKGDKKSKPAKYWLI